MILTEIGSLAYHKGVGLTGDNINKCIKTLKCMIIKGDYKLNRINRSMDL